MFPAEVVCGPWTWCVECAKETRLADVAQGRAECSMGTESSGKVLGGTELTEDGAQVRGRREAAAGPDRRTAAVFS